MCIVRVCKQSEQPPCSTRCSLATLPVCYLNNIFVCVCVVLCLYVHTRVVSMWFVLARVYKAATAACIPLGLTWNAILRLARTSHTVTRSVRLRERRDFEFIAHIAI